MAAIEADGMLLRRGAADGMGSSPAQLERAGVGLRGRQKRVPCLAAVKVRFPNPPNRVGSTGLSMTASATAAARDRCGLSLTEAI